MTETCTTSDPLTCGVFEALTAAEVVATAFANAQRVEALDVEGIEHVGDVLRGELTVDSFSRDCITTLRTLAGSLEPAILGETQTWFVHDECDMSGGHEESSTTEQGDALIWLLSSLRNLADRLSDVVKEICAKVGDA